MLVTSFEAWVCAVAILELLYRVPTHAPARTNQGMAQLSIMISHKLVKAQNHQFSLAHVSYANGGLNIDWDQPLGLSKLLQNDVRIFTPKKQKKHLSSNHSNI